MGEDERVVVRETRNPRPEDYVLRERYRLGYKEVRGREVLPPRREVLSYPRFPVSEPVERDYLVEVRVERFGQVRARRVKGHCEESDFQSRLRPGPVPPVSGY